MTGKDLTATGDFTPRQNLQNMNHFYLTVLNWQTLSAKLRWRDGLIAEGIKVNIMCNKGDNLHANCTKNSTERKRAADKRRYNLNNELERTDTNSRRSELAFLPQYRTQMTHIKRMSTYPCKSAPSAESVFYRRTNPRTKSTDGKVSGFISVHPRFFYDVIFQTGSTGWTGYNYEEFKL